MTELDDGNVEMSADGEADSDEADVDNLAHAISLLRRVLDPKQFAAANNSNSAASAMDESDVDADQIAIAAAEQLWDLSA